jgi:hypothetical protein
VPNPHWFNILVNDVNNRSHWYRYRSGSAGPGKLMRIRPDPEQQHAFSTCKL